MQLPAEYCHSSLEHSRTSPFHPCALWQSQVMHLWSDQRGLVYVLRDGAINSPSSMPHWDRKVNSKRHRWEVYLAYNREIQPIVFKKPKNLVCEEGKSKWLFWHSRKQAKETIIHRYGYTAGSEGGETRDMGGTKANAYKPAMMFQVSFKLQVRCLFLTIERPCVRFS